MQERDLTRRPHSHQDDDDRVIAPMDIDGMPWNRPRSLSWHRKRLHDASDARKMSEAEMREQLMNHPLSPEELKLFTRTAVAAGLTVWAIIGGALFLIVLLMYFLW